MLRSLIALVLSASAYGALLPDQVGTFKKSASKAVAASDPKLEQEFGLDSAEQADYKSGAQHFTATAWRFRDSTGAMAMFESRKPSAAEPAKGYVQKTTDGVAYVKPPAGGDLSVRTPDGVLFSYGNYVFQLSGNLPTDLSEIYGHPPNFEQSPLPALMTYLPKDGLIPNSERYVLGPASLDRFFPGMSPSEAAFHLGSEAQTGKYSTPKGLLTLAIFNYPTPNIARDREQAFQKIPGAIAKRVGPLVAVTLNPPDPDVAERILSQVKWKSNITLNQKVPQNELKNAANYILNIFVFAGLAIVLCAGAGFAYGGYRVLARKMNKGEDPEAMITLHLGGK